MEKKLTIYKIRFHISPKMSNFKKYFDKKLFKKIRT